MLINTDELVEFLEKVKCLITTIGLLLASLASGYRSAGSRDT